MPTYNPSVMVNIAGNIWWDSLAPGIPVAQGLTSVPILYFLSMPQMLGASPVFIQAFLFFILLFLMGYGMYLLALDIFGKSNRILAFSAGIFYLFNPYMMVQIWHRFIHNSMFFAAFLPFLILTWRAWIKKRNPVYLLLFLLVNFLAVYIFGTIAFIVAVWALLFLLTLLEAIIPWKGRKTAFSLLVAFLIGLIFWFLTNSWWLMPTFSVSPAILAEVHTTDDSLNTLLSLSNSTILPYTLRLINPFYLYWEADFGTGYRNIFFQVISWLFVPIVFIGFIRGLKQKQYIIWSLLFLIIIFLSKGAAPPFNFPYIWGFSHFFPLGVIRNPFEKLGILLPFIFAILFSSGLQFLLASGFKAIGRFKTIAVLIILILLQMTFFWPMFAGKLFGTFEKQNFVDVPSSYAQADRWIKEDLDNSKEGRILHLPLSNKEDIIYNWQYGYHGVEPSAAIFTSLPSIARGLDLPRVNDALSGLSLIFHKPNATDPAVILKMLQDFNVKYVILHKDVDWLASSLYNPAETEAVLDNLSFLERKIAFGNLIIYKLSTSSFSRKIKLMDNIQYFLSSRNNISTQDYSVNSIELPPSLETNISKQLFGSGAESLLAPESFYKYYPQKIIDENLLGEMPAAKILPDSPLYIFIRIKEVVQSAGLLPDEKFSFKLTLAGKRLIEGYLLNEKESKQSIVPLLKEYQRILPGIKKDVLARTSGTKGEKEISVNFIFSRHLALLELLKKSVDDQTKAVVEESLNKLGDFVKETDVIPNYQIIEKEILPGIDRSIARFNLPVAGKYELLQVHQNVANFYLDNLKSNRFQINNEAKELQGLIEGNFISYGTLNLGQGLNEVSFNSIPSVNLAAFKAIVVKGNVKKTNDEIEITSDVHDPSYIDIPLNPVNGGSWYQITFDSWIKLGNRFRIQVFQDTDIYNPLISGEKLPRYDSHFTADNYKNYWNNQKYDFYLRPTTTNAFIRIEVLPWDGCVYIQESKQTCLNKIIRSRFEQPGQINLRNINIFRILRNPIFLKVKLSESVSPSSGEVNFIKENAFLYSGKIKITRPIWLFFGESFDPGWELTLIKNKQVLKSTQHLLGQGFANVWLIEKEGEYDFQITYSPQQFIQTGSLFAGLGWTIIILAVLKGFIFHK